MRLSRHNIFSQIKDSENFFLLNLLSGQADILDPETAENYRRGIHLNQKEFIEKGYLINEKEEEKLYQQKYLQFLDDRDQDEIQIFFAPTYSCNFTCSYCYQDEYGVEKTQLDHLLIDAFFQYVDKHFAGKRKYITLFGGEPLMTGQSYYEKIEYFIRQCNQRNLELAVVTNGYSIGKYLELLKQVKIREIQVTLDGTEAVHNARRALKNKQATFHQIVSGINALLNHQIPVNLRMVVDKQNIDDLPALAVFAKQQGWTKHPMFKTQLGRNYELHHCQTDQSRLFDRISLYEKIFQLIRKHPEILEFHQPAFSISRFLAENGELPSPLYDACPGTKTEWAFDYTGHIYACTATVGKNDESLGTFYPTVTHVEDIIDDWQDRDVLSIAACKNCPVQLACGGGCASVAKNQHGSLNSPDCRPVKELLELGMAHYFELEQ
ncbi:MAG: radical SAM protein [Candidatus Cyclobacteriaceae bacterium M3_2C_046]